MNDSQWTWRIAWVACLVMVWLTWIGGLDTPFVYDDRVEVFPLQGRTLGELTEWADYNPSRPLVVLSYLLDFQRGGGEAVTRVFHWTSWWIHLLSCGAALFMAVSLGRLGGRTGAGPVGALVVLLWSIHPMLSEAVIYISARSELLCGLFIFLSIGCWATALRVERDENEALERSWPWRLGALIACIAAIGSKETGMVGPLCLVVLELSFGGDPDLPWWKRMRWAWWAPLAAALVFGVGLRIQSILLFATPEAQETGLFSGMGVWSSLLPAEVEREMGVQLATSALVWRRYISLWILPIGQTIRHGQADVPPGSAGGLLALAIWLGMVVGTWRLWLRNRLAGLTLILGALTLIPSTSFVPLNEHMAEHRSYQFGLFLLLGLCWALPRGVSRRLPWCVAVLLPILMMLSRDRVEVWSQEASLWAESGDRAEDTVEHRSEIAKRAFQAGTVLRIEGELEEAEIQLLKAIEQGDSADTVLLADGEFGLLYRSWNELGILRADKGDGTGAQEAFEAAIRLEPEECIAQNNLGGLQFNRGRTELARRIYMDSLGYCPNDAVALFMLGVMHYDSWKRAQLAGDPQGRQDILRDQAQEFFARLESTHPQFPQIQKVRKWILELTWHQ